MIGRRTMTGLAISSIPARQTLVLAALALGAAVGIGLAAKAGQWANAPGAAKAGQIASTLEAMPLWVLIGGSMTQLAARIVTAWDDFKSWRAAEREMQHLIERGRE